jgi:hypothetical protein
MGNHCGVAGEETALRCHAASCNNVVTASVGTMRIMKGTGEIFDFCNKTCLREFIGRGAA